MSENKGRPPTPEQYAALVAAGKLPPPIQIVETGSYVEGASVRIRNDEGWLHVTVMADESIIGYAITVNGKDLPYTP